jgi:hypothetical protein
MELDPLDYIGEAFLTEERGVCLPRSNGEPNQRITNL